MFLFNTMVINYDNKNNSWSTIKDNFKPQIKETVKTTTKELSSEIQNIFDDMDLDGDLFVQLEALGIDINNLTDTSIKDLSVSLGGIKEGTITAGDALKQLSTTTVTVTEKTSKAATVMKTLGSIGKTAFATFANMAIIWTITKGIELAYNAIDNYIHRTERLIEAGEEAKQVMKKVQYQELRKLTFDSVLFIK